MKQLKDILLERLVLSKTKSSSVITLGDFVRWYATPTGQSALKPEDKIRNSSIVFALMNNDKNYSKSDELVDFFDKNKNNELEDFTEEKLYENNKFNGFVIKFSVGDVNFTVKVAESFLEFLYKNQF